MGETTTAISSTMFEPIIESITTQITPEVLIGVIVALLGAGVVFAFMWWGVGFAKAKLMKAIKRGRV